MHKHSRAWAASTFVAAIVILGACSSSTGPGDKLDGPYGLTSIDGVTTGVMLQRGDTVYRLGGGGTLAIHGSEFDGWTSWTVTLGGVETALYRHCTGTVTARGDELRFTEAVVGGTTCGRNYTATWDRATPRITIGTSQVFDIGVALSASSKAVYSRGKGTQIGF